MTDVELELAKKLRIEVVNQMKELPTQFIRLCIDDNWYQKGIVTNYEIQTAMIFVESELENAKYKVNGLKFVENDKIKFIEFWLDQQA